MNLDNLLLRLQTLCERINFVSSIDAAPSQQRSPELNATVLSELSTDLNELQIELTKVSDHLNIATSTLGSIIYSWDIEQCIVDRTQGLVDVLGFAREEASSTLDWWTSRIHPDDKQRVRREVSDALASKPELVTEYRILDKQGSYRYVSDKGQIIRNAGGKAVRVIGSTTDITKQKLAEEAQHKSNEILNTVVTNAPVILYILDREGVFTFTGGKGLEGIGSKPGKSVGRSVFELYRDYPEILKNIRCALAGRQAGWVAYIGDKVYDNRAMPMRDETGQVTCLIGVATDITQTKQAEAALRESEARVQAILDNAPIALYVKDWQGQYLLVNQQCTRTSGFSKEQYIGKTDYDLFGQTSADEFFVNDQEVLATQKPLEREEAIQLEDGLHIYTSVKFPLFDATGVPYAVCGISTDITERKQVEEQVRFQARLLDIVEQAVITTDLNGTITYWNRFAHNLYGWSSEEAVGRNILDLTPAAMSKTLAAEILSRLQQGESWQGEFLVQRRDGTIFPAMVNDAPIFNSNGELTGIVGVSTDITHLKQAEAALRQANQELERRVQERTATLRETNHTLEAEIAERKRTEEALRQSEERFRCAMVHAPIPVMIHAEDGEIIQINQAWVEQTGYSHNDIPSVIEWITKAYLDKRDLIQAGIERLFTLNTRIEEGEFTIRTRYGDTRIWDFSSAPLGQLSDGRRLVISMAKDVTTRKQAEEALARREQEFKALVENAPDIIARYDRQLRHVYVNPAVETITGLKPEAIIGRTKLEMAMSEEALVHWCNTLQRVFETGCEQKFEFEFLTPSGLKYYQSRLVPEFAPDGTTETILNITRDITALKQAESALRESEERFRSLSACSPVGIFETDIEGHCLYTNPRCQEICGFTLEESLGEGWVQFVHPDDRDRVFAEWSTHVRECREYSDKFRFQTKEGIKRWIHVRSSPMFSPQGELTGHVGTVEDITTRQQAEADIRAALDKERELSELRNNFLSLVSHEFRTPLTTIRSSAELLERYNTRLSDEKKQTHHQRIQTAVDRMTQLLDEVLLIGQAEAGKLKFEPKPMNLLTFCQDLVEEMQLVMNNAYQGESHQSTTSARSPCEIVFRSSCDSSDVQMDEKLLGHILTNLLSNAIKYSPEGGTIQFDLVCTDKEAIFRIQDSGIGIPKSDLPQLFDSFQRASNVGTIQGTGLGLAIVKNAVELHTGTIAVESEVGVGTSFIITLPMTSEQ